MRICIIYLGRRGSGGPISLELATNLMDRSDICAVISRYVENRDLWHKSGIPLIEVPTYRGSMEAIVSLINQRRIRNIACRILDWKPDILLYPMFHLWTPFLHRRLRSIPGVLIVHDPLAHPGAAHYANSIMENRLIRQMERCVVFTKELGNVLERRGACARCIDVVPHGDLSYYRRYYPLTDTRSSCSAERSLLFFGRITPYKGLEILLEAFKPVSQRHSVKLTIAGKGDLRPYRPLLRSQHGVEIINRWIEEHEVAELFGQADMVILPYTSASQSGVLALAAAFELPVVATRVGGMPGQIDAGLTGLLVEPGSVEQLIGAIERLLDDPALAKAMGRSLFLEFSKNRNWSVVAEKVYTICERAIRDASNHPE